MVEQLNNNLNMKKKQWNPQIANDEFVAQLGSPVLARYFRAWKADKEGLAGDRAMMPYAQSLAHL